jgi:hypothetical protein
MPDVDELIFDADSHTYAVNGRQLPSVTQVIRAVVPGWQAGEWYLQRGRAVHHGCRLLDESQIDWETVDPLIRPQLGAWQDFRRTNGYTVGVVEASFYHPIYQYAGTIDRTLRRGRELWICDIKSSIEPQVIPQLGGYALMLEHGMRNLTKEKLAGGVAVQLKKDGDYKCHWLDKKELQEAGRIFLAMLTVYNFTTKHGIKNGGQQ